MIQFVLINLSNLHAGDNQVMSSIAYPWLLPSSLVTIGITIRFRLDVDIGRLSIELGSMPNQSNIGNGLQYQIHCLDVDEIVRWNPMS
jgi:hypothetical protein